MASGGPKSGASSFIMVRSRSPNSGHFQLIFPGKEVVCNCGKQEMKWHRYGMLPELQLATLTGNLKCWLLGSFPLKRICYHFWSFHIPTYSQNSPFIKFESLTRLFILSCVNSSVCTISQQKVKEKRCFHLLTYPCYSVPIPATRPTHRH